MQTTHQPVRVLAIAGSLRTRSYNRALLETARELAPPGMDITIFDIAPIPMYNADRDNEDDRPAPVERLKRAIADADALLFAMPEYNWGIPGVLKNAIDWASRPAGRSPMNGKTAAVMGATTGMWGTLRAQMHLREVLAATDTHVVLKPEVLIRQARDKFDEEMRLTDEATRGFVRQLLENLQAETLRRQAAPQAAEREPGTGESPN